MIGVLSKESEVPTVEEFFELFKTPWEFYTCNRSYDVVISTRNESAEWKARLVVVYGSELGAFDSENNLLAGPQYKSPILAWNDVEFPIYGNTLSFDGKFKPIVGIKGTSKSAGIEIGANGTKIVRIGYDLFSEVSFLLGSGQPIEFSTIPTLEIHISILRKLILDSKIPLVEIPPVPEGHRFMVCLTHDVDFLGIRHHKFDRSAVGFLSRVFFPYSLRDFRSKISWNKVVRNVKSLLLLPGIYLGLFRDFWYQLDRYLEIERDMNSTFFFIPFKDCPGDMDPDEHTPPKYRSTKYDISDYRGPINGLLAKGHEVGLHSLDAWHDSEKGRKELEIIRQLIGEDAVGVRTHWLYFSENSPKALEDAGFHYDSTLGYNDAVGYRSGTTQVFCLPGASNLFELPLNVQDTSMFYKKRMRLTEVEALRLCKNLISDMLTYGGVFTINWHQRSLGPERNWDAFYIELLRILKAENVWFGTARQAVNWFKKRRSAHFEDVKLSGNGMRVKLSAINGSDSPRFVIRIHHPRTSLPRSEVSSHCRKSFEDIPWSGESEMELTF